MLIIIVLIIIDDLWFVLVEECPQVPAANATRTVREDMSDGSREMKKPKHTSWQAYLKYWPRNMNQCSLLVRSCVRSWTPCRRCLVRPLIRSSMMLWNTFIMPVWMREPQCENMFSIWWFISMWQKWMRLSSMKAIKLALFWNLC